MYNFRIYNATNHDINFYFSPEYYAVNCRGQYFLTNWANLIQLWKYSNLHIVHVINNVSEDKLDNVWINAIGQSISLRATIIDYLRHFKLHLSEINELIESK